jgi:hypothetical protein
MTTTTCSPPLCARCGMAVRVFRPDGAGGVMAERPDERPAGREVCRMTLEAGPSVVPAQVRLRRLLKHVLRVLGFKALTVERVSVPGAGQDEPVRRPGVPGPP